MNAATIPTVGHATLAPLVVVSRDTSIREVARLMTRTESVLVAVEGDPLTVVDTATVVRVAAHANPDEIPAVAVATPPVMVELAQPLIDAIAVMTRNRIDAMIAVDDYGVAVGALTLANAVDLLLHRPRWVEALKLALHIEATREL